MAFLVMALASVAMVVLFNAIIAVIADRARATGQSVVGLSHIDLLPYYACAREPFDEGHIVYATPYSSDANSPRIYSHFAFLLMGLVWQGLKTSILQTDQWLRLLFGSGMLFLGCWTLRTALPRPQRDTPVALACCVLVIAGGGLAWLAALFNLSADWIYLGVTEGAYRPLGNWFAEYPRAVELAEGAYGEWGASLVRVLFSVPECIYHVIFFGSILCVLHGRRWIALVLLVLAWWSHPFTGVLLGSILMAWLGIRALDERRQFAPLIVAFAINALFAGYNLWLLPRFPEHASVMHQMLNFPASMPFGKLVPAYGLLFLAPLLGIRLLQRHLEFTDAATQLMLCWAACELALVFHDRLSPWAVQPMHFTRGYLYIPLAYFTVRALHSATKFMPRPRAQLAVAASLLILQLPDTWFYFKKMPERLHRSGVAFSVQPDVVHCLAEVDKLHKPVTIHVMESARLMGAEALIPVLTRHRALAPHPFNTPFISEKKEYLLKLESATSASLLSHFVDAVIMTRDAAAELTTATATTPMLLPGDRVLVRVARE